MVNLKAAYTIKFILIFFILGQGAHASNLNQFFSSSSTSTVQSRQEFTVDSAWVVPAGVTKISVTAIGGGGGSGMYQNGGGGGGGGSCVKRSSTVLLSANGGNGGSASGINNYDDAAIRGKRGSTSVATMTVTPGETLNVFVGGGGGGGGSSSTGGGAGYGACGVGGNGGTSSGGYSGTAGSASGMGGAGGSGSGTANPGTSTAGGNSSGSTGAGGGGGSGGAGGPVAGYSSSYYGLRGQYNSPYCHIAANSGTVGVTSLRLQPGDGGCDIAASATR